MTISLTLNSAQIVGLPDWAKQDKYDIEAKPDTPGSLRAVWVEAGVRQGAGGRDRGGQRFEAHA
jgi:hypothetical protein